MRRALRRLWQRGAGARLLLLALVGTVAVTCVGAVLWLVSEASTTAILGAALLAGGMAGSAALLVGLVGDARLGRSEAQHHRNSERQSLQLTIALFPELVRIDLSNRDLSGFYLRGRNLTEANLAGANLDKANLEGANLVKANLAGARLVGCNLRGANLRGANLSECDLSTADLGGAKLVKADLTRANLTRAYLAGSILPTGAPPKPLHALTAGADLSGADLTEAVLTRANLTGAVLAETNLSGADLSEANPITATLSGAVYDSRTRWPHGFPAQSYAPASRGRERSRPPQGEPQVEEEQRARRKDTAEGLATVAREDHPSGARPASMFPLAPEPR